MKIWTRYGVLALGMLWLVALQGHAQTLSPRTGNAPTTQTLTLEQFNRLPSEVQLIMKQHPDRFIIDQGTKGPTVPIDGQGKATATPPVKTGPAQVPSSAKTPENAVAPIISRHPQQQQP